MSPPLPPPFIEIPGINNFRDIGDGELIRQGRVFRSADPTRATTEGMEKMQKDLGLKIIFDLRSMPEIRRDGPEWANVEVRKTDVFEPYGITREWTPVFAEQDYGPEAVTLRYLHYTRSGSEGFVQAYYEILLAAPAAYGAIFKHLAQPDPAPCLVHCTAGKDRTGVLIALLLLLAGQSKEKIVHEYSLTDLGLADVRPIFVERLLQNPALAGNRDGVVNMCSSRPENMDAAIDMIRREFQSPEEYMRKYCKMTDAEIEQVRKNIRCP